VSRAACWPAPAMAAARCARSVSIRA
jgi:hypothetical protein